MKNEYDIFETRDSWLRNEPFYSWMPGLKLAKEHAEFFGCTHITGPNGTIAKGPDNKWRKV